MVIMEAIMEDAVKTSTEVVMDKVEGIFNAIAQQLGVAVDYVWPLYVKLMFIKGLVPVIVMGVFLVAAAITWFASVGGYRRYVASLREDFESERDKDGYQWRRREKSTYAWINEDERYWIWAILVICGIGFLIAFMAGISYIPNLLLPEAVAIENVLKMVRG
jgi:hypothetical protein